MPKQYSEEFKKQVTAVCATGTPLALISKKIPYIPKYSLSLAQRVSADGGSEYYERLLDSLPPTRASKPHSTDHSAFQYHWWCAPPQAPWNSGKAAWRIWAIQRSWVVWSVKHFPGDILQLHFPQSWSNRVFAETAGTHAASTADFWWQPTAFWGWKDTDHTGWKRNLRREKAH